VTAVAVFRGSRTIVRFEVAAAALNKVLRYISEVMNQGGDQTKAPKRKKAINDSDDTIVAVRRLSVSRSRTRSVA